MNDLSHAGRTPAPVSPGAVLPLSAIPSENDGPTVEAATVDDDAPAGRSSHGGFSAWLLYGAAVAAGLVVAVGLLLTVLLGRSWPSVAVAAVVVLVAGLATSGGVAPALRRRAPAMLAGGFGAGLMAGGLVLGSSALMIATS